MKQSRLILNGQGQPPVIACGENATAAFENLRRSSSSDTELIALILHSGIEGHSVLGLASQLIAQGRLDCRTRQLPADGFPTIERNWPG